ncbi:hypothetical protein AMECASPLE_032135 [Ameca splendens]|uniref:Uncharacterized protein n=1 Tax=Ameca splendens TaxID=208324 RepID=A0ABV0Y6K2_9TELE
MNWLEIIMTKLGIAGVVHPEVVVNKLEEFLEVIGVTSTLSSKDIDLTVITNLEDVVLTCCVQRAIRHLSCSIYPLIASHLHPLSISTSSSVYKLFHSHFPPLDLPVLQHVVVLCCHKLLSFWTGH